MSKCSNIDWKSAYSIGHDKIDHEHKKLFKVATKALSTSENPQQTISIIKELVAYTKNHFKSEEKYMASVFYNKLEKHKKLHKEIIKKLTDFISEINQYSTHQVEQKLIDFIQKSLIHHILVEDKKVHHYVKDKKELRSLFQWRQMYNLNISLIDKEHQKLFDIGEQIIMYEGKDLKNYSKKVIKELYTYMQTHFENEETLMRDYEFTLLDEHIKLHENIILQMDKFIKKLPIMNTNAIERKVIEYMDVWLVNHIITEDKKFDCYLKSQI